MKTNNVYEVCPRKESRLKKYLVCAMVSVLGACQTPTASNQGTTSSKGTTGTGPAFPSSVLTIFKAPHLYEVRPRKDKRGVDLISVHCRSVGCGFPTTAHNQ